jgi:hypothetical protein
MKDTPDEITQKQLEIFYGKSVKERFLMNLELTEFVRDMTRRRILRKFPDITENELKAKIFREFYSEDFTEDIFKHICNHLINNPDCHR